MIELTENGLRHTSYAITAASGAKLVFAPKMEYDSSAGTEASAPLTLRL